MTTLVRDLARRPEVVRETFPFSARAAAPGIDEVDWASLDGDAREVEIARLRSRFADVDAGTIPLADQGCGRRDVLVITGPDRGTVWTTDAEKLWIAPARNAGTTSAATAPSFQEWLEGWLSERERQLAAGSMGQSTRLWV
jgi:hypothetical protein